MTTAQWNAIQEFKNQFSSQIQKWLVHKDELIFLQKKLALEDKIPPYNIELPIVYNKSLDQITKDDEIKLILIGDNPGKNEQLFINSKYLVGLAGKIGEKFFNDNPQLNINFRKNVIILNKTPIHSAKTIQLKKMSLLASKEIQELILETQEWMAKNTVKLMYQLQKEDRELSLWLVGYSELKKNGIFTHYKKILQEECLKTNKELWNNVYVFQHFSMNRFTIDLHEKITKKEISSTNLKLQLQELGNLHKKEIFS